MNGWIMLAIVWGLVGIIPATLFYLEMLPWARTGQRVSGAGFVKLWLFMPAAWLLWPATLWVLYGGRR